MNDATIATNIATNDVHNPKTPLDSRAGRTGRLYDLPKAASQPCFEEHADRQVKEDKAFYIPDLLSDEEDDSNREAHAAAVDHAKHLGQAEHLLGEALNLVGLLLASLGDESDSRAMQIDTALRVIEKKLSKAYNRIDKHDRRHTNLFLAYFDLRGKADEGRKD